MQQEFNKKELSALIKALASHLEDFRKDQNEIIQIYERFSKSFDEIKKLEAETGIDTEIEFDYIENNILLNMIEGHVEIQGALFILDDIIKYLEDCIYHETNELIKFKLKEEYLRTFDHIKTLLQLNDVAGGKSLINLMINISNRLLFVKEDLKIE